MLKHKAKIDWLRLGDGNNSYFHASIKSNQNAKSVRVLYMEDGTNVTTQEEIKNEVLDYYGKLMGKRVNNLKYIDIEAMRDEAQLNMEQREYLVRPVTELEICKALIDINDQKSFGLDGFGSRFLKANWNTIKDDVITAIMEFFGKEILYKAFNCNMVTLIPKSDDSKYIKDHRPIYVCTITYKIISKVLTTQLGMVLKRIIGQC